MRLIKNPMLRHVTFAAGVLLLIAGVAGIFIPLWPTTPFLLAAAWCFFRSSRKAYFWLRNRPYLGKAIEDWEQKGAISTPTKFLAVGTMAGSIVMVWILLSLMWVKVTVSAVLTLVSAFVLTRPKP